MLVGSGREIPFEAGTEVSEEAVPPGYMSGLAVDVRRWIEESAMAGWGWFAKNW